MKKNLLDLKNIYETWITSTSIYILFLDNRILLLNNSQIPKDYVVEPINQHKYLVKKIFVENIQKKHTYKNDRLI